VEEKKKERMSLVRQRQWPEQRMEREREKERQRQRETDRQRERERERDREREREGRREGRLSRHSLKIALNKKYCAVLSMRSEVTCRAIPRHQRAETVCCLQCLSPISSEPFSPQFAHSLRSVGSVTSVKSLFVRWGGGRGGGGKGVTMVRRGA
jgi:hypothetical protein